MTTFFELQAYFVAVYPLLMSFVWIVGGLIFYFRWERKPRRPLSDYPLFSLIIAAHNEEDNIEDVIHNLAGLNYPKYEIVVVNDGSTDRTPRILERLVRRYPRRLKVLNLKPNCGKAKAINAGVLFSRGELLFVLDADCFLDRNSLRVMAWHFVKYPRVGAVTGNPRIMNRTSLLGKIQVGEYSSIIGLIRRTQRILGKVLTVSGAVAAYRRQAFYDCGFFDSDTATEDIDITWKLQKKFWEVRYEPRALCFILSPETIKGLWSQRVRWAKGGIGVVKKHYDIWFSWKHKRFWPVYAEYVAGVAWAFCLGSVFLYSLVSGVMHSFNASVQPFLPPIWLGPVLALVCMLQFLVSMYIDHRYEDKSLLRYYFWIIWYPFFYWIVSALSVYAGIYHIFIRKGGSLSLWKSPDRGLHVLRSSINPK